MKQPCNQLVQPLDKNSCLLENEQEFSLYFHFLRTSRFSGREMIKERCQVCLTVIHGFLNHAHRDLAQPMFFTQMKWNRGHAYTNLISQDTDLKLIGISIWYHGVLFDCLDIKSKLKCSPRTTALNMHYFVVWRWFFTSFIFITAGISSMFKYSSAIIMHRNHMNANTLPLLNPRWPPPAALGQ